MPDAFIFNTFGICEIIRRVAFIWWSVIYGAINIITYQMIFLSHSIQENRF